MASTKVRDGLSYQAALRWVMGCGFCNETAARVIQEKISRKRDPAGRAWCGRWPGRTTGAGSPRPGGTHLRESNFQLPAQDKPFQDLGRVRRGVGAQQVLGGAGALGVADQHPANEDGRLGGAVPDRHLRREFHRAGGAVIPGHSHTGPSYLGLVEEGLQWRRAFSGGGPSVEEGLQWRRAFSGGGPSVEEGLQWRRAFNGGGPSTEEGLQWRRAFNGGGPSVEEGLQRRRAFSGGGPSTEEGLQWRRAFNGGRPSTEEGLQRRKAFNGGRRGPCSGGRPG